MNYKELFEVISTTGTSKANRSKYNSQLRASGWSDAEIKTARACKSESMECLSKNEIDQKVVEAYQLYVSGHENLPKIEQKSDDRVDNKKTSLLIIHYLKELREIYSVLDKNTEQLDTIIDNIS